MRLFGVVLALAQLAVQVAGADPPRLLRSVSGPSGKTVGADFVIDETRTRFVYPNDKSFVIYFEWEAPLGDHVLTAVWKQPDGRVSSISPDVKIQTNTPQLRCYWGFTLYPGMDNGVWTLEVRIDGQPAGSHPFEVVGMPVSAPVPTAPKQLTLDDIYKTLGPSVVWIRKLDGTGRRFDLASGFVLEPNVIATSFQAIDSAARLEVEFADGRKSETDEILGFSRNADWALLRIDTHSLAPIRRGDHSAVAVGEHLAAFNVDGGTRILGTVDIGGQGVVTGFGRRIQISPAVAPEAAGGPLIDTLGTVVGILGGSLNPGSRIARNASSISPGLWALLAVENGATAISELPASMPSSGKTLAQLADESALTKPLTPMPEFIYGGTTANLPARASDPMPPDASEFSKRDRQVSIYSMWARKGKLSRGEITVIMFDSQNRVRMNIPAKKLGLSEIPQRFSVGFSPATLDPGVYRLDLNWDGRPAWRTFIRVTE